MIALVRRVIWGALFGGALGAFGATITTVGLYGYQIALVDRTDVDRVRDFRRLSLFLPRSVIAGFSVGVLGGLVASIPAHRISIPLAIAWVATGACAGRLISIPPAQTKGTGEISILPTIVGGFLAAALLLAYGIWHRRQHPP